MIGISSISIWGRSQEQQFIRLDDQIKALQNQILIALVSEKGFEKTLTGKKQVFISLNQSKKTLSEIDQKLLGEDQTNLNRIKILVNHFSLLFSKMISNTNELKNHNEMINHLAQKYSNGHDQFIQKTNTNLAAAHLLISEQKQVYDDVNPGTIQEVKNTSLNALTQINQCILLINQDLLLEGNIDRFLEKKQFVFANLEIQRKNMSLLIKSLKGDLYKNLSNDLKEFTIQIQLLSKKLADLYLENLNISKDLLSLEQETRWITNAITKLSEKLREEKNNEFLRFQLTGQGILLIVLLCGGIFMGKSITHPLRLLTNAAESIDIDYLEGLKKGISGENQKLLKNKNELGILARSLNQMRLTIVSKIEEANKSSQKLLNALEFTNKIINESPIGIAIYTPSGDCSTCNVSFSDVIGATKKQALQQNYNQIKSWKKFGILTKAKNAIEGRETKRLEVTLTTSFNKDICIDIYFVPIPSEEGVFLLLMINNITQRINAERALQKAHDGLEEQVGKRTQQLNKAKEIAEIANNAKSDFLATMSHELRTPLNAILGFSDIMSRDKALSNIHKENLNIINRSGVHLLSLINEVLTLSKIESGRITFNESNFDLYYLLNDIYEMMKYKADEKGLSFTLFFSSDLSKNIKTDEKKLRQILINIVGNAIKFTSEGYVKIRIFTKESKEDPPKNIIFEIEDSGFGIEDKEIETLFDPFVQSTSGKKNQEGTGLGLTISEKFVNLMGGEIDIKSQISKGSVFRFHINVTETKSAELPLAQMQKRVIGIVSTKKIPRILNVEDRLENRLLLKQLLQSFGFEVLEAKNGREAIDTFQNESIDFIFMDMRMPVMSGYDAVKKIRQLENEQFKITGTLKKIPIAALTASAFEEDRQKVLSCGCDEFIRKPFKESDILNSIKQHLNLKYTYEEGIDSSQLENNDQLPVLALQEHLTQLPENLFKALEDSALNLNQTAALSTINKIEGTNAVLASTLRKIVDNFQYDKLLDQIELVRNIKRA